MRQSESKSKQFYKDFIPLKKEINDLRGELGLENVAEDDLDTLQLLQSSTDSR